MSVQVSYRKQAVFGLMLLLVILSAVEIISRIVLDERDSCNQSLPMSGLYEHLTISDLKKICQDYYHNIIQYPLPIIHYEPNQKTDTVTINSHGFRGEELEQEKTDDKEYRIFVLGGSVLYGIFATSDNTTIPGYLQEFYNEFTTDRDVRVINAGVNGHESFAETYIVKNKIIDLDPDLIIVLDGWSKAYSMTGWRIGYIGAPEYIARACNKMQGQITSGANCIAQRATITALNESPERVQFMVDEFKKRRDLIISLLNDIPTFKNNMPEGAFYVFPDVSYYFGKTLRGKLIKNAVDFSFYLLEEALVATVDGEAFGNPDCIRISYAASQAEIIEAIKRIKAALV